MNEPVDPGALLPHRGPALWIERVVSWSREGLVCAGRIPSAHAAIRRGAAPSFVVVELGAQAAALHEALLAEGAAREEAATRPGYVVRIRGLELDRSTVAAESPLEARVRSDGGAGPLALYRMEILAEGSPVARGRVATWRRRAGG